MITCKECKYSDNCPCGYSLHNAACLVIQKPKDKKKNMLTNAKISDACQ